MRNSHDTTLSTEDICTILDLYVDSYIVRKVPPLTAKVGGDNVMGSPALSIVLACSKKGSLSSLEDEMSQVMASLGESIGMKPTNHHLLAEYGTIPR